MKKSIAFLPLLFLSACVASRPGVTATPAPTVAADFTLTPQTHPYPWQGFGACMNPYLYAYPNTTEIDDASLRDLERKVVALHPQMVRIFLLLPWFHAGHTDAFVAHNRDTRVDRSFIRTAELAQRAGADINVTLWYGPWIHPEAQGAEFADILDDLVRHHGLTRIRYATIQNEANSHPNITQAIYTKLYTAFDAELRKRNLRDQIQIVSGDLVYLHQDQWFAYMADDLGHIADDWSSHVYWDYTDTNKLTRRLDDIRRDIDALPPGQRRPLQITEFGVRGDRPARQVEPGSYGKSGRPITETSVGAAEVNRFVLEAANRGFTATVQWDLYDAWYDRKMRFGLLGDVYERFRPKPGYWSLYLFTHTTPVGSRALVVRGSHDGATVAAFRTPTRAITIYAQNNADHLTNITLAGLDPNATYRPQSWNATGYGSLARLPDFHPNPDGTLQLALHPYELIAVTTAP